MWTYLAPLKDMQFVLEDVLQLPAQWRALPPFADIDDATAAAVLEEAGKFASGVLAPLNAAGDLAGCRLEHGQVVTPAGFPQAYRKFVDGGWPGLTCDPADGGQGLPAVLGAALNEMLAAANHGWTMYPGLLHGAYECLRQHGSEWLRGQYLEKVASGEWLATMNLTEPQAGSDLSGVRTRAVPASDGAYALTGSKIFISGGDHDLTDNIVHLVLARLPDAPAGTKGLSLFLAPKLLQDGRRNAISVSGIEKKMGIKASATCAMEFEGAVGWLVGEPHRGLPAMFVMMNSARLHVAMQGLGHGEAARQNAMRYAAERVQGGGRPIIEHASVRRMLWRLEALTDAQRVVGYQTAHLLDQSHHEPTAEGRLRAQRLLGLLTPTVKAMFTEVGHRLADEALQVWGGYGYIHDCGIEQTVRDSRIPMLYEGTNEIQALDLLQRKVVGDGGAGVSSLVAWLAADLESGDEFSGALAKQLAALQDCTAHVIEAAPTDKEIVHRVADDFLRGLGFVLLSWAWLRIARAAQAGRDDHDFRKLQSARFGIAWIVPEADAHWHRVMTPLPLDHLPPSDRR